MEAESEERGSRPPTVDVGRLPVSDVDAQRILQDVRIVLQAPTRVPAVYFALHVGGLNRRHDHEFRKALENGRVVYADGISVVVLARLAAGKHVRRASTTDIGIPVIHEVSETLGRATRVALVGGGDHVRRRAADKLERDVNCKVVLSASGFQTDYSDTLDAIDAEQPDILFVGMGMPKEALWVDQHMQDICATLTFTCGGWFGFLAGTERRAPRLVRGLGCEWIWRLVQRPRYHWHRYSNGAISFVLLMVRVLRNRVR